MPISTEAIGLVGVSKAYPGITALDDVTFSVARGRVHGFLGPNGAGKSTTMNIITGLLRESSGSIRLMGEETSSSKRKTLIGYLPEQPPVYPQMLVLDYLNFVAAIHGKKSQEAKLLVSKAMSSCGLESVQNRMIGNLSKGYRQRVGIAQALVFGAEILILDEPTVGLDPVSVSEIRDLIKNLKGEHTVLLSSHLLHEISLVCDDITMINRGKLVASGTLEEIQARFASGAKFRVRATGDLSSISAQLKSDYDIEVQAVKDEWLLSTSKQVRAQDILKQLVNSNIGVSEFFTEKSQLEDIFKEAMKEEVRV